MKNLPVLRAGDIGLSSDKTFLSKAIRFFEKLQTGEANRSHAWSMISPTRCIEALWRVTINPVEKYDELDCEVWRLPLSDADRMNYSDGIMLSAGQDYGLSKIPLHALDSIASIFNRKPVFFFTRSFGITSFKDCSQLTVWALHRFTSYVLRDENHDPVDWRCISPDYLQDLLHLPHNGAEMIYKFKAQK